MQNKVVVIVKFIFFTTAFLEFHLLIHDFFIKNSHEFDHKFNFASEWEWNKSIWYEIKENISHTKTLILIKFLNFLRKKLVLSQLTRSLVYFIFFANSFSVCLCVITSLKSNPSRTQNKIIILLPRRNKFVLTFFILIFCEWFHIHLLIIATIFSRIDTISEIDTWCALYG